MTQPDQDPSFAQNPVEDEKLAKRKKLNKRILIAFGVVFALIIVIAIAGGGGDKSDDKDAAETQAQTETNATVPNVSDEEREAATPKLGDTIGFAHDNGGGRATLSDQQSGVVPIFGEATGTPVAFNVVIEGLTGTTNVNPFWFKATTDNGLTLDSEVAIDGGVPAVEIGADRKAGGLLQFDVPEGLRIELVTFNDPIGRELAAWKIPAELETESVSPSSAPPVNAPVNTSAPVEIPEEVIPESSTETGFTGAPTGEPTAIPGKEISECLLGNDYQPGTTVFTDGSTGWTQTCADQWNTANDG